MMDIADFIHRTLDAREDAAFSHKFPQPFSAADEHRNLPSSKAAATVTA